MTNRIIQSLLAAFFLFVNLVIAAGAVSSLQDESEGLAPVAISENGKYLVGADGIPFLWIADTAWNLTQRLTREEIETYLDDRKDKGFTVILFRIPFQEVDGEPQQGNPYGQVPFTNKDISQPNEAYFELVDFALDAMEERGMVAGLLPLWGSVVGGRFGYDISADDIVAYANWLSQRYEDRQNIVWVSGGDTGKDQAWEILGRELKKADQEKLVTFHPGRKGISSYHLYGDVDWLDFHMVQTGHSKDLETNYLAIEEIYNSSAKPVLNGEPAYEDIVDGEGGRISPHQVRKAAYWSLLAGGFGHDYGHVEIFQFARAMEGQPDTWGANNSWTEALGSPGVMQMAILADLLQSVPWYRFSPNQDLILSENLPGPMHIRAAVVDDGSLAWIYFPEKQEATIDLGQMVGRLGARWLDPATGQVQEVGNYLAVGSEPFTPPFAEDALLMFGPPVIEDQPEESGLRVVIIIAGSLLALVLFALVLWQIKSGIG